MVGFRTVAAAFLALGFAILPAAAQSQPDGLDGFTGGVGGSNVTVTRNIDNSSNLNVSMTINGQRMGYGLTGDQVMGQVLNSSSEAAAYNSNKHAVAAQIESSVLSAVGLSGY